MERNSNDYSRETSDYRPNFILREPSSEEKGASDGLRKAIDPLEDSSAPSDSVRVTIIDRPDATAGKTEPKVETPARTETPAIKDEAPAEPKVEAPAEPKSETPAIKDETPAEPRSETPARISSTIEDDDILRRLTDTSTSTGAGGPQARETMIMSSAERETAFSGEREAAFSGEREAAISTEREAAISAEKAPTPNSYTEPRTGRARAADLTDTAASGAGSYGNSAGRPLFENPHYDDGSSTGNFRDPRNNFRVGESASWQSGKSKAGIGLGERKQTKSKERRPVAMSKKVLALLIIGSLLLSALCGFGGVLVGSNLVADSNSSNPSQETTQADPKTDSSKTETAGYTLENATGSKMSVKEITAAAKDSVVEIRTESATSDSWMQNYVMEGAGSGVIISKDGYIMTNNHVISGARKIKVNTADEKEYDAELIGTDENNDVAVIKVDASDLSAATLGNSDELEVGDLAVAIGNPLGELGGTVTAGIISAKDRALSIDGKTLHLLQTDSSINPGNSGGGLFNDSGQLIGLVVAKSSGSDVEGLGFAIPINTAANVANQLMDKGYVSGQPSTGMTYQEGSGGGGFGTLDSLFGSGSGVNVYIYSVNGANAKKAGFKEGDIVLAVDGEEITSFNDLSSIVTSHKVGDELEFTVQRDGNEKTLKLTLEEKQVTNNDPGQDDGSGSDGEGSQDESGEDQQQQPGSDPNGQFPPFMEDEGGSLFDFFFGR